MVPEETARRADAGVDDGLRRPGGISYLHIPAPDPAASASFYETVFGWTVQNKDTGRPGFQDGTGHVGGAWVSSLPVARDPGLMPYIYVTDIDSVLEAIASAGGAIVKPPFPEGNLRVAEFKDPAGNVLGLWEAPG